LLVDKKSLTVPGIKKRYIEGIPGKLRDPESMDLPGFPLSRE